MTKGVPGIRHIKYSEQKYIERLIKIQYSFINKAKFYYFYDKTAVNTRFYLSL